ncbi:response regulator transcription factor [Ferrovibrio sp.]|uniref:response regulator transcription factor n=1 Tax=Ferrovibrio sp. TaxID=1917215 RepID=UPI003D0BC2D9
MASQTTKILLAGFDDSLVERLHDLLAQSNHLVLQAQPKAIDHGLLVAAGCTAAVIELPGNGLTDQGMALLAAIRSHSDMPIVAVARGSEAALRVRALEAGAHDVLSTPWDDSELLARLHSLLQRCRTCLKVGRLCYGDIVIDQVEQSFRHRSRYVSLSRMEMRLLRRLVQADETTVPNEALLQELWGKDNDSHRQSLRVLIRQLRAKIEDDPRHPSCLINDHGIGYRLRRV